MSDVYRDGAVHVMAERCATCIFRPGNLMSLNPGRVKSMVDMCLDDEAGAGNIPCHETTYGQCSGEAICRGFWDGYADRQGMLTMATRLGLVREVTIEELKSD